MVKHRCILITLTLVIVVVVLVIGVVEVGLLIPPYKIYHVINSDNYTEGDTDVSRFDPLYCKAVEMTKSNQSTASLHLLDAKPPLSWWDILEATLDDTLQPEHYFSDWSFHIHPGSEMTVDICAVKSDPLCVPELRDEVWFRIIRGEENFNQWRGNQGNPNYAVKSFELPISLSKCHTPLTLQYHYEEEGDFYHIVKNSGNCAISIYANITINRTQYDNEGKSAGNCKIPNPQSSYKCSVPVTTTHSPYYAFLAVDQTSIVTKWKNDIQVTLVCIPRDWIWIVSVVIATVGILATSGVLLVATVIHCYRLYKHRIDYENIPGNAVGPRVNDAAYAGPIPQNPPPPVRDQHEGRDGHSASTVSHAPSAKEAPSPESGDIRRILGNQYGGTTRGSVGSLP